jgi:hypothetical protein
MLNLLRLRDIADYSEHPELAPSKTISGREAFQKYIDHTLPFQTESGGKILFLGRGGPYFVGPQKSRWDLVMLIQQRSLQSFFNFASNVNYMAGIGHRTSAIVDSRLLPIDPFWIIAYYTIVVQILNEQHRMMSGA